MSQRHFDPVGFVLALCLSLLLGLITVLARFVLPALFTLSVWASRGLLAVLAHLRGRALGPGEMVGLSTLGWGLIMLAGYPWLVSLGLSLKLALLLLLGAGVGWGLCVGQAAAQMGPLASPVYGGQAHPASLLGLPASLFQRTQDDTDRQAAHAPGVVIGQRVEGSGWNSG